MVVVDSSVWIDHFNGAVNASSDELARLLGSGRTTVIVPDLVLFEVLRGFAAERALRQATQLMHSLQIEGTASARLAVAAAQHYRKLRARGVTVASPIDVLVASFCIEHDYLLLHRDRDFEAFEAHCGLRIWHH